MTDTVYGQIEEFLNDFFERAENPKKTGLFKKSKTRKANLTHEEKDDLNKCIGLLVDQAKVIHEDLLTITPDKAPRVLSETKKLIEDIQALSGKPSCKEFNRILKLSKSDALAPLMSIIKTEIKRIQDERELSVRMGALGFLAMEELRKKQEHAERLAAFEGRLRKLRNMGGGRRTLRKRRSSRSRSRKAH